MIGYKNVTNEYVAPVDLQTLGTTFSTLEKGHQEAVKAESELKLAIAELKMNEKENGFKVKLLNDIQNTIDTNTIYGNKYGALDEIVYEAGNIVSNPAVLGRIKAQEEYSNYMETIDSFEIPEPYKEMYRELNEYTLYQDTVDPETNTIIGGNGWKPKARPTKTINFNEILKGALNVTRKETGNYHNITFLDANGKPISDINKSFDGSIYQQTDVGYEKIPIDKLMESIKSAINNTPGAKESLIQDFNYLNWNYNKYGKNDENAIIFNESGRIVTFDDYLKKRIDPFIAATTGTNYTTKVSYGDAMENYQKYKNSNNDNISRGILLGGVVGGTMDVGVNAYQQANDSFNKSNIAFMDIMKNLDPDGISKYTDFNQARNYYSKKFGVGNIGPGTMVNNIVKYFKPNMSNEEKLQLHNAAMAAYNANSDMNKLLKTAGENADGLKFGNNVLNQDYTSDNKYGKDINDILNSCFVNDDDTLEYELGEEIYKSLCKLYGTEDLKDVGINYTCTSDGNYEIIFNKENCRLLPKFASEIRKADEDTSEKSSFWSGIKNAFGDVDKANYKIRLTPSAYSLNYDQGSTWLRILGDVTPINTLTGDPIWDKKHGTLSTAKALADIYDEGVTMSNKAQEISGSVIRSSFNITDADGKRDLELRQYADIMKPSEYEALQRESEERLTRMLQAGAYSSGQIFIADENMNYTNKPELGVELQTLISTMYTKSPKDVRRSYNVMSLKGPNTTSLVPQDVYFLSFQVPTNLFEENSDMNKKYGGKLIHVAVSGFIDEGTRYDPTSDPYIIAEHNIDTATKTKTTSYPMSYDNSGFGACSIKPKEDGNYSINFMYNTIDVNRQQAIIFEESLIHLQNIEFKISNRMYQDSQSLNNSIDAVIDNLYVGLNGNLDKLVIKDLIIKHIAKNCNINLN